MRTETITLCQFDELSDDAKETAVENYLTSGHFEFSWIDEWFDSLKAFSDATEIEIRDYNVNLCGNSYVNWRYCPDNCELTDLSGLRLRTWLINNWLPEFEKPAYINHGSGYFDKPQYYHPMVKWTRLNSGPNKDIYIKFYRSRVRHTADNCPLTGFCGDMSLIDPILEFIKSPDGRDLEDLIQDCFGQFIKEMTADMEDQTSFEYIADFFQANEFEFHEDGTFD